MSGPAVFPFTALVGQQEMKTALLLNAVAPETRGVLIRGEKGTAKSTAARALAALLPEILVVAGCPYSCDPRKPETLCPPCGRRSAGGEQLPAIRRPVRLVELPLNATEDKVVGSLDFTSTMKTGAASFSPGLLARANRGLLYIDEVNLLNDHLVDAILDAAESGVNRVEREGVSYTHPARFVLVGSMNPEEGEIRPQLLDRFGLCVNVQAVGDAGDRILLVKLREAFDLDPGGFQARYAGREQEHREKITRARTLLPSVTVAEAERQLMVEIVISANVAGHRADLILNRAARALAALSGDRQVKEEHIQQVYHLVLAHRARPLLPPQDQPPEPTPAKDRFIPPPPTGEERSRAETNPPPQGTGKEQHNLQRGNGHMPDRESVFSVGEVFKVNPIHPKAERRRLRRGSGKRTRALVSTKIGRYVRSTPQRRNNDLALDATLRAAAPYQPARQARRARPGVKFLIEDQDIREKVRERRVGNLLLFIVDASGSMSAYHRMVATKGAIMSLLLDAYRKRDKLGMVAFRKSKASVLLPPTNSIELARRLLEQLSTGGKTPLSDGLATGYEIALNHLRKDLNTPPLLVILTDGRANVSLSGGDPWHEVIEISEKISRNPNINALVIDTEEDRFTSLGMAGDLAAALHAPCKKLTDLKAEEIADLVRTARS